MGLVAAVEGEVVVLPGFLLLARVLVDVERGILGGRERLLRGRMCYPLHTIGIHALQVRRHPLVEAGPFGLLRRCRGAALLRLLQRQHQRVRLLGLWRFVFLFLFQVRALPVFRLEVEVGERLVEFALVGLQKKMSFFFSFFLLG